MIEDDDFRIKKLPVLKFEQDELVYCPMIELDVKVETCSICAYYDGTDEKNAGRKVRCKWGIRR